MKKSLFVLALSTVLLTGCGGKPASVPDTSSSLPEVSSTPVVEETSSVSEVTSSSEVPSTSISSSETSSSSEDILPTAWTDSDIASLEEAFGKGIASSIPFIYAGPYELSYIPEMLMVQINCPIATDQKIVTDYEKILSSKGYMTFIDTDGILSSLGYYTDELTDSLNICAYQIDNDGGLEIDILQNLYSEPTSVGTTWSNADVALITKYFGEGIEKEIPAYLPNNAQLKDSNFSSDGVLEVEYEGSRFSFIKDCGDGLTAASFILNQTSGLYEKKIEGKGTLKVDVSIDFYGVFKARYSFVKDVVVDPSSLITWLPVNFTGTTYASTELTINDIKLDISGVMLNKTNEIQMSAYSENEDGSVKKKGSHIANVTPMAPLSALVLDQVDKGEWTGNYKVYAGMAVDTLSEVIGSEGKFNLEGATFFKIDIGKGSKGNAVYLNSITFGLVKQNINICIAQPSSFRGFFV